MDMQLAAGIFGTFMLSIFPAMFVYEKYKERKVSIEVGSSRSQPTESNITPSDFTG